MQQHPNASTPIEIDDRGRAVMSGIKARNHADYAVKAGFLVALAILTFHPLMWLCYIAVLILAVPTMGPGMFVTAMYTNHIWHGTAVLVLGLVLLAIGFFFWTLWSIRFLRGLFRAIAGLTEIHYVQGYKGPTPNLTARGRRAQQARDIKKMKRKYDVP